MVPDLRASQLGTLGAALTISGQPEEAVPLLEQALVRGGTQRDQSARAFFLGEALRALGRMDAAAAAYSRAVKEGDVEFAQRAEAQRGTLTSYRG